MIREDSAWARSGWAAAPGLTVWAHRSEESEPRARPGTRWTLAAESPAGIAGPGTGAGITGCQRLRVNAELAINGDGSLGCTSCFAGGACHVEADGRGRTSTNRSPRPRRVELNLVRHRVWLSFRIAADDLRNPYAIGADRCAWLFTPAN